MKYYWLIFLSSLILASCNLGLSGNRKVREEAREVAPYSNIVATGGLEVTISEDGTHKALVKADANLLPYIETKVEEQPLYVSTTKPISSAKELHVFLSTKQLRSVSLSGAVEFKSLGTLKADKLNFEGSGATETKLSLDVNDFVCSLSGASQIDCKGRAENVELEASGASEINWYDFEIENLDIAASGACDAEVFVNKSLRIELSGASELKYRGQPKIEKTSVSGASEIKPAN